MKESIATTAKIIKRITLDDVYQEIETKTGEIKKRQEEDFRYLNRRIDDLGQKIDNQIGEVRQEIGQMNRRFDTVIQMILDLSKQIAEIAKQRS